MVTLSTKSWSYGKQGPLFGRCDSQTERMETFLRDNFGSKTIVNKYIVPDVKLFHVDQLPSSSTFSTDSVIYFPSIQYDHPFLMTIDEIRTWQKPYVVYADNDKILSIDKPFLIRALQGQSKEEEAFRMKFLARITTCSIFMEFNARVININLNEEWPHRIKLVSVRGVNSAGRMHDINDIFIYLKNWRDIYLLNKKRDRPIDDGKRDLQRKKHHPHGVLDEQRLHNDLIRMARLRLHACDCEAVQIGIDNITCKLSAEAIKQALEEDASTYTNIIAVIFAMPIFETDESTSTYKYFVDVFEKNYLEPIPVMIADQNMHRLTVAIARQGSIVSELNPADLYRIFEEYLMEKMYLLHKITNLLVPLIINIMLTM